MSKERARARAAREAAAAQERAAEPPPAPRAGSRRVPGPAAQQPTRRPEREQVYRLRRFPPLPWRLKAALAVGWVAVVLLVLVLFESWSGRLGLIVVATAMLPLIVVLVRDPTRRTR